MAPCSVCRFYCLFCTYWTGHLGKSSGSGVCFMINSCCGSDVTVLTTHFSPDLELLTIKKTFSIVLLPTYRHRLKYRAVQNWNWKHITILQNSFEITDVLCWSEWDIDRYTDPKQRHWVNGGVRAKPKVQSSAYSSADPEALKRSR